MNFVIFDLEWNNAYNYKTGKGMNEIIEIGAVKLDKYLNVIDTFSQLIKPKLSKKLSGRFKNLTHITPEEISNKGICFEDAVKDFARWSGGEDSVFMSWSNSDLYVLVDNFKKFIGSASISFIKKYADLQKYCQSFIESDDSNQISLSNCAECFGIFVDANSLHRALEDCFLSAECFQRVYDKRKFVQFISSCDNDFFERLVFKPFYLTSPVSAEYDVYAESPTCPYCKSELRNLKYFESVNKSFRTICECKECRKKFWVFIRAKKTYDGIDVTKRINVMNRKKANKIDNC